MLRNLWKPLLVAGYTATEYEANADEAIFAGDRQGELTWAFSASKWQGLKSQIREGRWISWRDGV